MILTFTIFSGLVAITATAYAIEKYRDPRSPARKYYDNLREGRQS